MKEKLWLRGVSLTVFFSMLMQACASGEFTTTATPLGDLPIPTPEATTNPEGEVKYPTEVYCAPKLKICVAHQFDSNGQPLSPAILINSETVSDLSNNKVILKGDLLDIPEEGWGAIKFDFSDKNKDGKIDDSEGEEVSGYMPLKALQMSVNEFEEVSENMDLNQEGKLLVKRITAEARSKGENVKLVFRQIIHTETNEAGEVGLARMTEKLWLQSGNEDVIVEGRSFGILEDDLIPLSEQEIWSDSHFASLDVVNNVDSLDEIVMEVYPASWIEVGGGNYVSPEFIEIQQSIAASGERFTLVNNSLMDGAEPVPGLTVAPDGTITIQVGDETVALDPADVSVDDEGLAIKGYTIDPETGKWTPLETPHIEDFIKITSSLPVETLGTETTPRIAGAFEVDEALCYGCEIQMPEALAEEILGGYMARFMHRFGAEAREGQPSEAEIASALEKIAQAQRGEISAAEAVMTIPAYLLSQGLDGKYSEVKIVFRMGTDMEVPEGVIPIDTLSTLDVEGYITDGEPGIEMKDNIPGLVKTHEAGVGFGTVVDETGRELILVGSPSYLFGGGEMWVKELQLAKAVVLRNDWIIKFGIGQRVPKLVGDNSTRKPAEEIIKKGFEVVK